MPFPVLVLRDTVVVLILIVLGGLVAAIPYGTAMPDPRVIQIFQAVFGTVGFGAGAWMARSRRPLRLTLAMLGVWLLAGVPVALGGADPVWWLFLLPVLAVMATLGGGLALLFEKFARD